MGKLANKNKISYYIQLIGLLFIIASFLLLPSYKIIAQEEANTNEQTNTNQTVETNTNSSTDTDGISSDSSDSPLEQLNEEIDDKREIIDNLKKKAEVYEENIKSKQTEAISLQNQLSIIDIQIVSTENDIVTVEEEIDKVSLEMQKLEINIEEKGIEVDYNKELLAEFLRLIYLYDQKTYLEIFVSNNSFSEFFDQMQYTKTLEGDLEKSLVELKEVKAELESTMQEREDKQDELKQLSKQLSSSIVDLGDQKDYKSDLLVETKESEEKFSELLDDAKSEMDAVESEIYTLESKAREKLSDEGIDLDVSSAFMWPVSPVKGISAYFHDPEYIFRKYFEHPAIDIPAPQGTPIRAADNGYVVRAKNAGLGYSYIMLVHNNEMTTVYGHVSQIDVAEDDYVVRGQQIGLVGGTPGTPGAGRLTTGPHLHFEVRSGGIPVNPLDYLPGM
ncbi:peptidoglycan DD-metalloendopeptidase family protein [Patescibacteria group bacterium]|nr:peptidoglycan DD-metalloendopeptidase family protein [Patescibacteria group bacterium]MBU0964496.1 peptidoglycan DD-metalloendopeptidase family protein [Patescibacteria group bacterium]